MRTEIDRRWRGLTARGRRDRRGGARGRAGLASIPLSRGGPAAAIALFLLAIVIASVAGGLSSGLIAALLSSLALPFLYGAPRFRLRLNGTEEVVTAVVFLAVAMVVGLLVGGASEERARASRREREARLLGYLSTKLLTGELPDRVLDDFADGAAGTLRTRAMRDHGGARRQPAARGGVGRPTLTSGGPDAVVPLVVGTVAFGTLKVERPARQTAVHARRARAVGGGREAGRRRARPRAARRPGAVRTARGRDEPAASRDVLVGDPRPAHARSRRSRRG